MRSEHNPTRLLLLLEQTRGNMVHARHLERAAKERRGIEAVVVRLGFGAPAWQHVPVLGNWSARASWNARRLIQRELRSDRRPNAMLIHTQVPSLLAVPLMRQIPTVLSIDATPINFDSVGVAYGHRRGPGLLEQSKWLVNRRAFRTARAVVAFSAWAASSAIRDYGVLPARVSVIRPGVDRRLFRPAVARHADARPRILFVGDDFERKGGCDLIAALASLSNEVELDLVTHSPVPPVPPNLVVRVHRNLRPESPQLVGLFQAADIFALPSRGECFGHAIVEAMACGVPVVSTRVGAIPELVQDGVNGLLVPPGSAPGLAAAIRRLVSDANLRRRMGGEGLELVRESHDCEVNGDLVLSLLEAAADYRAAA